MQLLTQATTATSAIGLDIGSNAVRAVELTRTRRGTSCKKVAQVGLPRSAVVDGEIVEHGTVTTALRRLWNEGGFTSRNVVVSASGQRVVVRQADVPRMSESDFRSSLTFQAMDLIPIPVDDAVLDFVILPGEPETDPDRMQILLAAAHRQAVDGYLFALRDAGLHPLAVDPAPMAIVRAAQRAGLAESRTIAVVDVGADLTVIAVRERGMLRFTRILNSGGRNLTDQMAARLGVGYEHAESIKRLGGVGGTNGVLTTSEVHGLVGEIQSSMTYFASQLGQAPLEEVWLTGGPSHSAELVSELANRLPIPVALLDPFAAMDVRNLDLDEELRLLASSSVLPAIGAAEWLFEPAGGRISLLPKEIAAAAARRRGVMVAAAGVGIVAAALGATVAMKDHQVTRAHVAEAAVVAQNGVLSARIPGLEPAAATEAAIRTRLGELKAAAADNLAWTQLLGEISAVMPARTRLSSIDFTDTQAPAAATAGPSQSGAETSGLYGGTVPGALGTVSFTVSGHGTEALVAKWLDDVRRLGVLDGLWVPSASAGGGKVSFTSNASITKQAPIVHRPSDRKAAK